MSHTILVVEDEGIIAADIQRTLIKLGYRVPVTARSSTEALDAAERINPGLALMDIKISGEVDGIDTAHLLRARHDFPIVFLTSYSDDATLTRAQQTLPAGYLIKPFTDRDLRVAIELALHKHALEPKGGGARGLAEDLESRLRGVERLAALGTVAASMAHEINNPLTFVLTNLDLALEALQEEAIDWQEIEELVQHSHEGAAQLRQIVRDARRLSRPADRQARPVEVSEALEVAVRMTHRLLPSRGRITRHYGITPLVAIGESQLAQVFVNLLANAAQAIAECDRGAEVKVVSRTEDGREAIIEIIDDGPGMSPEVQARIFEPFFTTKPAESGTGLGLAISRKIVERSGGKIEVESDLGRGSTFRVRLPAASAPIAKEEP
jgi:signal transduction histidine kinase